MLLNTGEVRVLRLALPWIATSHEELTSGLGLAFVPESWHGIPETMKIHLNTARRAHLKVREHFKLIVGTLDSLPSGAVIALRGVVYAL